MLIEKFAVPFVIFSLENWQEKKKIILNSLPDYTKYKLDSPNTKNGFCDVNHYSDYFENFDKSPEYASDVISCITNEITKFCDYTKKDWRMTNLWFQVYEKYNNFSIHNHGPEGWSAVLYVEFDSDKHHSTVFYSPYPSWEKENLGAYKTFSPEVKEGDLIIFPSSLQHEAVANFSDEKRTIISFNLKE